MKIIKRDGRVKDFDIQRISKAVSKAYFDVYGNNDKYLNDYIFIEPRITHEILKLKDNVYIEDIQDIIVKALFKVDKDVCESYEVYREKRQIVRDNNSELYKKVDTILNCKNVLNSNANVDEHSFGGRKFESAGILLKSMALTNIIKPEIAKAHLDNRLYIHDLDSYAVGFHNCSFTDIKKLVNDTGFVTRNGDVRPASGISTAMQQLAVIFQIQSQEQFGGTGSSHIDYDLEKQVNISFRKYFSDALLYLENKEVNWKELAEVINVENAEELTKAYPKIMNYTMRELDKEGKQSAQALYHNLNTLESRPGSQVPFTSINFGRNTTVAGRLVSKWLLLASIDGIGKYHKTSIFPISIFQYKKGVNDKEGTPNYDLKKLAIESMSKRIYPNWVNCDWSNNPETEGDPDTHLATMGCRTLIGYDRHGMGYSKVGRGNVSPVTINLIKIGIKHGVCLSDKNMPDIEGFWKELNELLELSATTLVDRFNYICSQSSKSAPFMYKNKSMLGGEYSSETCIYDVMKHGSHAIGYIGVAEMCQAMFGKSFVEDKNVYDFALSVVQRIADFAKESSDKYDLNFGAYASPAESTCGTIITGNREIKGLRDEFGIIKNVTDRDWATNSHHVPVWEKVDVFKKLELEAPFTKYATSGCITYIELDSTISQNPKAIEQIIDYAFNLDIPYLAFNFPIDTCLDCGYQSEFNDCCPMCGSKNIEQLRRVTGYLTTDYHNFNKAKQEEVQQRFKHSTITKL